MTRARSPLVLEAEAEDLPDAPSPADAPPPDGLPDPVPQAGAGLAGRVSRIGGLFWGAVGGLIAMALGVAAVDFAAGLMARAPWLGWIAGALVAVVAAILAGVVWREVRGILRLRRLDAMRRAAAALAAADDGPGGAEAVLSDVVALYAGRPEHAWAAEDYRRAAADIPDPADRLPLAERLLLRGPDAAAQQAVIDAARTVATLTALIPIPAVDVVTALIANLRMVRRIAEAYGGAAGTLGSLRLMRAVAVHMAATGAVAVADDLLGPLVGGGILGKLSRRFGEGAMNAAMTARVGVIAIEMCRPLPFAAGTRPTASAVLLTALAAWRSAEGAGGR